MAVCLYVSLRWNDLIDLNKKQKRAVLKTTTVMTAPCSKNIITIIDLLVTLFFCFPLFVCLYVCLFCCHKQGSVGLTGLPGTLGNAGAKV